AGLRERLGEAAGGSSPLRRGPSVPPLPVAVTRRQTEQAHVAIGVPAPDRHSSERWALAVLNHTLGGGLSSRLFQEIRERRGLAYSVYSYRTAYDDTGALVVYAGTSPERAAEVVDLIGIELSRMAETGLTPREASVARAQL